jgi:hypothetical protein
VAIPLSGRVPEKASGPSQSRVDDGGGSRCVSGKLTGSLGFSHRGVFIGEGAALEVDQGLDGAELTFVDEVKMTGHLKNPKRRF